MTHAYDEVLLERAASSLGRMLDYSVHSLHHDITSFMDLFAASGVAGGFERGDIRLICGMSGIELAYEVLDRSGIRYERTVPRHTRSLSGEYWCGYALALMQWQTCLPFEYIMKGFSPAAFISEYSGKRTEYLASLPLDISESDRTAGIREFGMQFASDAASRFITAAGIGSAQYAKTDTPLKKARIKSSLSQSGLARASGIPVRTIQQYEQRQKDLSRARAGYLVALGRVLNCDPSELIEN